MKNILEFVERNKDFVKDMVFMGVVTFFGLLIICTIIYSIVTGKI